MKIIASISELREYIKGRRASVLSNNRSIKFGFVPTMGYLHEGHASLLRKARSECHTLVLSIFVNPLQFGPNEDFERYPRNAERDLRLAETCGTDIVFMPSIDEMYPHYPLLTKVTVSAVTERLCGASRPGHFDGVATVVLKLLNIVDADRAYFGMKDAQQVAVIEQMVRDVNLDVEIVRCPIVREADGLAMSSRNVYLKPDERRQAVILSESLGRSRHWAKDPQMTFFSLRRAIIEHINQAPSAVIDYVELLQYPSLQPIEAETFTAEMSEPWIAALAVKFGNTRLIDNFIFQYSQP